MRNIIESMFAYGLLFSPIIAVTFYLLSAGYWLNRNKKKSIISLIIGIIATIISILFYTSDLWWNPLV